MISALTHKLHKTWRMRNLYENWGTAVVNRLHFSGKREIIYKLRNGVRFSLSNRSEDVQTINEIWIDQVYTRSPEFEIRDGWTVLDIGGHKGIFSVYAATSARGVRVLTYEASPENFRCLRRNVEINGLTNVRAFNLAVSSSDGEETLYLAAEDGCNSLIHRTDAEIRGCVAVQAWSLARILRTVEPRVHLLKMDIEGMEYAALLSCPFDDLGKVERIALEYHDRLAPDGCSSSTLSDFLRHEGFEVALDPERPILLAHRM